MILVTGSKGFIAGHLMRRIPQAVGCDKEDDIEALLRMGNWEAIFHLGAISDTTCDDEDALHQTNVKLTLDLARFCSERRLPFIYASSASVYGNGDGPLNLYAESKMAADNMMMDGRLQSPWWYGLRFFNVYGPGEEHKGKQASMVHQLIEQVRERGDCAIFDPGARRDFVHVDDVVSVMLWLWKNLPARGIYDVGTGRAREFAELAEIVGPWTVINMPASLEGKYQRFTQADLMKLRDAGCHAPFLSLEEGVARMIDNLLHTHNHRD